MSNTTLKEILGPPATINSEKLTWAFSWRLIGGESRKCLVTQWTNSGNAFFNIFENSMYVRTMEIKGTSIAFNEKEIRRMTNGGKI